MVFYSLVTLGVALCLLLSAEWKGAVLLKGVSKTVASAAFVTLALFLGGAGNDYGRLVLAALVLSFLGDLFLLSNGAGFFKGGIAAFLLAHLAYVAAFISLGIDFRMAGPFLLLMLGMGVFVLRWVWPHVTKEFKIPVGAYVLVITAMVILAAGASPNGSPLILFAAIFFYFSDISVARDRFVKESFVNRAWGLPLYYLAQVLFALSIQKF
ncbi:MAG: lysoplasmalogenase [Deltaproteobacteria bacterium]|nr:lysoplasmalogenase [Deltaproteobacteria bacterium]